MTICGATPDSHSPIQGFYRLHAAGVPSHLWNPPGPSHEVGACLWAPNRCLGRVSLSPSANTIFLPFPPPNFWFRQVSRSCCRCLDKKAWPTRHRPESLLPECPSVKRDHEHPSTECCLLPGVCQISPVSTNSSQTLFTSLLEMLSLSVYGRSEPDLSFPLPLL